METQTEEHDVREEQEVYDEVAASASDSMHGFEPMPHEEPSDIGGLFQCGCAGDLAIPLANLENGKLLFCHVLEGSCDVELFQDKECLQPHNPPCLVVSNQVLTVEEVAETTVKLRLRTLGAEIAGWTNVKCKHGIVPIVRDDSPCCFGLGTSDCFLFCNIDLLD